MYVIIKSIIKLNHIIYYYEHKFFCIPITFNNSLKACFSNKKYPITIQIRMKQIVKEYFWMKNRFLTDLLKIIGAQNKLTITFCSDLVCNRTLKDRTSNSTQEFWKFEIFLTFKRIQEQLFCFSNFLIFWNLKLKDTTFQSITSKILYFVTPLII